MVELKYKDIKEKITGTSFEVHKFPKNGFQEVIYQRALAYEFSQCRCSLVNHTFERRRLVSDQWYPWSLFF